MITCLHTAEVHVGTFGALIPQAAHVVRSDLLQRARDGGLDAVREEASGLLSQLAVKGPVLCTCSTLGPIVDDLGLDQIVRIDRPAMMQAAAAADRICVAICLDSTREATVSLFQAVAGSASRADVVMCDTAWPFFESGDMEEFAEKIAKRLADADMPILLAQASMAIAAERLRAKGHVVFTTPEAAAEAVIRLASDR